MRCTRSWARISACWATGAKDEGVGNDGEPKRPESGEDEDGALSEEDPPDFLELSESNRLQRSCASLSRSEEANRVGRGEGAGRARRGDDAELMSRRDGIRASLLGILPSAADMAA